MPPFFCHFTGVETIKAGTPVAQFILIPNEQEAEVIDLEDDKNYKKERQIDYLQLTESFNRNYGKMREFWKKYGW